MPALNIFPARVPFVNPDGTLTAEAYRALQGIFARVGGALGDSGVDSSGQELAAINVLSDGLSNALSDINQSATLGAEAFFDIAQNTKEEAAFPDVVQQPSERIGYTGTITSATLAGKTITVKDGIITNFV